MTSVKWVGKIIQGCKESQTENNGHKRKGKDLFSTEQKQSCKDKTSLTEVIVFGEKIEQWRVKAKTGFWFICKWAVPRYVEL